MFIRGRLCCSALVLLLTGVAFAQEGNLGPPVGPDAAKAKVGEFLVNFTEKSPDSDMAKIDKRMGLKPAQPVTDYDLTKESIEIYKPAEAGADGKFGIMAVTCYSGHQWPPAPFKAVLEKYHLIWIGIIIAEDSRPVENHAGLLLDATYNARKLWPVDDNRVYMAAVDLKTAIAGMPFYYSDIFTGTIMGPYPSWFFKIKDPRPNYGMWDTDEMVRPQSTDWDRAKSKSRIFLATRIETDDNSKMRTDLVVKRGFGQAGFAHLKSIKVPLDDFNRYIDWKSDWFEQGVQFLDEAGTKSAKSPTAITGAAKTESPKPAAATDDSAAKASAALDMARNYVALGKYDATRTRLNEIIADYPNTPAAKQAKQVLAEIADK